MSLGRFDSWFNRFAQRASHATGRPLAFVLAFAVIAAWAITGPMFGFDDTWQLVINTGTTIVTFLMVFLIQSTQNRDTHALQIKLDELIRATEGAHDALLDLEELDDVTLDEMRRRYIRLARQAREHLRRGERDTDTRELDDPDPDGGGEPNEGSRS